MSQAPFPNKKYSVILADPPWRYKDKLKAGRRGVEFKYNTMSDSEILSLPVQDLAAENCMLFLWATFPRLPLALEVISAWGFTYKTIGFNWVKTNKIQTDKVFWGGGSYTRSNSEICLLATKGKPKRINASVHSVVMSPVGKHSQKPNEIRQRIELLCGDVTRIELFARDSFLGWDNWGDQAPDCQ